MLIGNILMIKSMLLFIMFINFLICNEKSLDIGWESLSLEQKIGQMIMIRVNGDYYHSDSRYKNLLEDWISKKHIGGVIAFSGSIHGTF